MVFWRVIVVRSMIYCLSNENRVKFVFKKGLEIICRIKIIFLKSRENVLVC